MFIYHCDSVYSCNGTKIKVFVVGLVSIIVLVVLSGLFYSLGVGYVLRLFSLLIMTLLSTGFNDDGITEDIKHIQFLYLSKQLASGLGFLIIAMVMQIFGRKIAHIVLNCSLIISLALYVIAKHISVIFLAQVIQGISVTGIFVEAIILCEYCHKKRRGLFMALEKSAEWIGGLLCHLLSSWIPWRYVCLIGSVPPCVAIALTILWPESPYFHAMNEKYEECAKSFHLLHGESEKQRTELHSLISVQQKKLEQDRRHRRSMIINTFRKFSENSFWKVFLIMTVVITLHSMGTVTNMFSVFNSHRTFRDYGIHDGQLIFYAIMLLASLLSCSIILIERRTVLLVFGLLSVLILLLASIFAALINSKESLQIVYSVIILFHEFFINLSIMPVCAIIFGELYFLEHKGIGVFTSGIVYVVVHIIQAGATMPMVSAAGLGYAISNVAWCTALCLTILFFILPETKDKTLQEIEDKLRGNKKHVAENSAGNVEMGQLLQKDEKTEECN